MATEKEILIGLIGVTGAGKSTFAATASGRTDLKIGRTLKSCETPRARISFYARSSRINRYPGAAEYQVQG